MTFHSDIKSRIVSMLDASSPDREAEQLHRSLVLLATWRGVLIKNTILAKDGMMVEKGPFAGLDFLSDSAEGCHIPKLLGCYEQPLQPMIEEVIAKPYDTLLNIGCSEGYYAVGLAKRMPNTRIIARDRAAHALKACRALAEKNGVAPRIALGEEVKPEDFSHLAHGKTLLLCDIEGSELELIDPVQAPALETMDIIVEAHDCDRPGISRELMRRFEATHAVTMITDDGSRRLENMPDWFLSLSHLDQLLAVWEWRIGPTPWLILQSKHSMVSV